MHDDLRLEVDGVFKSWAVTKGPSIDPNQRRLAAETEDHPLDYGDFEGTIPEGEYGGGTVMLWGRGFWAADGDAAKALCKGELRFTLVGEKLQGTRVLVRLRHDREHGKRNNWLLIKRHDGYEREGDADGILARDRSVASGMSIEDIGHRCWGGPGAGVDSTLELSRKDDAVTVWVKPKLVAKMKWGAGAMRHPSPA